MYWTLFLPFGIYIGFSNKNVRIRKLTIFSSVMVMTFYLVISFAQQR